MGFCSENKNGEVAQLVERRIHNPEVKGSIPFLATVEPPDAILFDVVLAVFCFCNREGAEIHYAGLMPEWFL